MLFERREIPAWKDKAPIRGANWGMFIEKRPQNPLILIRAMLRDSSHAVFAGLQKVEINARVHIVIVAVEGVEVAARA